MATKAGTDRRSLRRALELASTLSIFAVSGCASHILAHKDSGALQLNQEFDQAVSIVEIPATETWVPGQYVLAVAPVSATISGTGSSSGEAAATPIAIKVNPAGKTKSARKKTKASVAPIKLSSQPPGGAEGSTNESLASGHRLPELEDAEGFVGRRPTADPYRVGEKVVLQLSYFGVTAGDLTMEMRNYAEVNGRKAYRFAAVANSRSVFAMVYAVDDWAETYVDYETLVPSTYALHVKESKQLREQRMFFDWPKLKAHFFDKRITDESGVEEKRLDWDAEPFAQTIFSGPFYLRAFKLEPGKKLAFRVANEGKNYVFTGEVLRRETITVPAGTFNTVVVRPKIQLDGQFQQMGEILFWLTDDDRKFFVRIESKIRIGTIVGVAKSIDKGAP